MPNRAPPIATTRRLGARALLLGSLILTALVYLPGISGGFVFDDYANIIRNDDLRLEAVSVTGLLQAGWSGMAGPLKRPLAMMSFALNYATTGDSAAAYKLTNLVIHLVNGVLLFIFLRLILLAHGERCGRTGTNLTLVAAVAAAIWLVHPLNLTSVLYVVQRMNSLSAMFSLAAMICYCAGRRRLKTHRLGGWWFIGGGVPMFIALGLLSKENAGLTLPLIALVEVCFFRLVTARARDRKLLIALFAGALFLPGVAALIYLLADPDYLTARFASRSFTLEQRLLTEARVLWFYLSLFLVPKLSEFGLYHDDYQLSVSVLDPLSTIAALGGIVLAVVAAASLWRRYPMVPFAIGWFLIGHALEASVIPIELVHEHRNYLPLMGPIFALCYGCATGFEGHVSVALQRIFSTVIIGLCATLTVVRAGDWSDPATLAAIEAERHPNSFRAVYDLGRIQINRYQLSHDERDYNKAVLTLERSAALDVTAKRPLVALLRLEYDHGREPKPVWKVELLHRYENSLFHRSDNLDLHELVKCRAELVCAFPQHGIIELYHAALSNPTIPSYSKAQLLIDLAVFYVNEAGNFAGAMELLDDAVALHPREFGFRKVRAEIFIMAGRYDAVDTEIRFMRSVSVWADRLNSPLDIIDRLKQRLETAKRRDDGHRDRVSR